MLAAPNLWPKRRFMEWFGKTSWKEMKNEQL